MKRIFLLAFILACCDGALRAEPTSFIVAPQEKATTKHSANTLKEMIGEVVRDLFKHTVSLTKQLGSLHVSLAEKKDNHALHRELGAWQVELASVQQQCSHALEKLIENKKPFKTATKKELQGVHETLVSAESTLSALAAQIKSVSGNANNVGMKTPDLLSSFQGGVKQTKALLISFNLHTCLKMS